MQTVNNNVTTHTVQLGALFWILLVVVFSWLFKVYDERLMVNSYRGQEEMQRRQAVALERIAEYEKLLANKAGAGGGSVSGEPERQPESGAAYCK